MANLRFGRKNEEWVTNHPHLAVAIANLRAQAQMGEEHIIRAMRGWTRPDGRVVAGIVNPEDAPSYGDVRASFARYKAGHGTLDGETGKRWGGKPAFAGSDKTPARGSVPFAEWGKEEGHSEYRHRYRNQDSQVEKERLDRQVASAYMVHAEVEAEEWADPEAFEAFDSSTDYERSPPF